MKIQEQVITAIDLGTNQCTTLIAAFNHEKNDWRVVGLSTVPSRGIKKSNIVDLDQAVKTIASSLELAEKMSGLQVHSVTLSISGSHISSQNSDGMIAITDMNQEISNSDIDRVIDSAKAFSLPSDREILYLTPRFFKVDSQDGIKDPVGMVGLRLESEVHMITGGSANIRNLEKCMKDLGLGISNIVFSGLAAAEATLSETEKELGVISVNIGAGSTSYCVYVDGAIIYSGSIQVGAYHITKDIAAAFKISFDYAERIKLSLRSDDFGELTQRKDESPIEFRKRKKTSDNLDLSGLGIPDTVGTISKDYLYRTVIGSRVKQIFGLIEDELNVKKLNGQIPAGAVISGGGALTLGLCDIAGKTLGLGTRIGYPTDVKGVINNLEDPRYATIMGLLAHAQKNVQKDEFFEAEVEIAAKSGAFQRFGDFFKRFLP